MWESNGCREIGSARAPHRSVADTGFGFRHLARSRSDQPLIDVPAQPAAVHLTTTLLEPKLLSVAGTSRGYSTAARALVGKSYAPSAPHAGLRTPDTDQADEGLRLAVDVGRGARGQRPARNWVRFTSREGSTGSSCLACPARSFTILPLLLRLLSL